MYEIISRYVGGRMLRVSCFMRSVGRCSKLISYIVQRQDVTSFGDFRPYDQSVSVCVTVLGT
jgi:hypothetical protein